MIDFSVVILTYNEEKTIDILIRKLRNYLAKFNYEIIIIDSGSTDKTLQYVGRYKNTNIRLIKIRKNQFSFG